MGAPPVIVQPPVYVHHQLLSGQQTRTIALTVMPIGRLDGPWARRLGVARCTAKDALDRLAVPQHPSRTIALLDLQIGRQDGPLPRRLGAVRMRARAAQLQLVAHERNCGEALCEKLRVMGYFSAGTLSAIFRREIGLKL